MQILSSHDPRERVGFVVPRWTAPDEPGTQGLPFRCFPVAGALHNRGFEVVWVDQEQDVDLADRRAELLEALRAVRIVFFWTNELWPLTQLQNILVLTAAIREVNPGVKVAVGGTFPSASPATFLHVDSPIDYFLQGYGETSAPELVEALDDPERLARVAGLVRLDREAGVYRSNDPAPRAADPVSDAVHMYRELDLTPYIVRGGIFGNDQPTLVLGTGHGCAKRCGFCYWRNLDISLVPPEAIVDLAEELRDRYGVRQFHLAELDMFASRARPLRLARLWKERLPDCLWFSLCSPVDAARFSDDDWDELAAGGCGKLEFGTESGSARMIERIGKRHDPADVLRIMGKLVERDIHSMHNIIFGFVGETAEDRRATLRLIDEMRALDGKRISYAVRIYQPTPGTPMGDEAFAAAGGGPANLESLAAVRSSYDAGSQRTMPWLPARDESEIKSIVGHYLPLANSLASYPRSWQRVLHGALRGLARWRLRAHVLGFSVDALLHRRLLGDRMSLTYRP